MIIKVIIVTPIYSMVIIDGITIEYIYVQLIGFSDLVEQSTFLQM